MRCAVTCAEPNAEADKLVIASYAIDPKAAAFLEKPERLTRLDAFLRSAESSALATSVIPFPQEAEAILEDMAKRGYLKGELRAELFEFVAQPQDYAWESDCGGIPVKRAANLSDTIILAGYPASLFLSTTEFYAPTTHTFESREDLVVTLSAFLMQRRGRIGRHHYQWKSPEHGDVCNVSSDMSGNLVIKSFAADVRTSRDPLGRQISFRPIFEQDIDEVKASDQAEIPLLVALMRYASQVGLQGAFRDAVKRASEAAPHADQEAREAAEAAMIGFEDPLVTLDGNDQAPERSFHRLPHPRTGSYGLYLDSDNYLCFVLEEDEDSKLRDVALRIPPADLDQLIQGLFTVASGGGPRRAPVAVLQQMICLFGDKLAA